MPAIETKPAQPETRTHCPLCDAALDPQKPNECPKCDWVTGYRRRSYGGTARDKAAAALSLVPGLGHLYKGHFLLGALLMHGAAFAVFACGVVATATAGFGLLLLPLYWLGVMMHVYWVEDRRGGAGM
jgi:hypothetical protein